MRMARRCGRLFPGLLLVVIAGSVPLGAQSPPRRVAREDLRLGGVNATKAAAFIDEPKLVVDYDGRIYALTPHDVRVFDRDGTVLMTLGRDGDGPGEFRNAFFMGFLADTLWVVDAHWRPARVTRFLRSSGKLLDTTPREERHDESDTTLIWRPVAFLEGDGVLAMADDPGYFLRRPTERTRIPIAVAGRNLEERHLLGAVPFPAGLFAPPFTFAFGPFPVSPIYAAAPDGSRVVTLTWDYERERGVTRVRAYDPHGGVRLDHVYVGRIHAVPRRVRDSLLAAAAQTLRPLAERNRKRGLPAPSDLEGAVKEGLPIPADFPAYQKVVVGVDGSIWLRSMRFLGDTLWQALDADGRPAFSVAMPSGVTVRQASLQQVWATAKGEYDAPLILRYRIEAKR